MAFDVRRRRNHHHIQIVLAARMALHLRPTNQIRPQVANALRDLLELIGGEEVLIFDIARKLLAHPGGLFQQIGASADQWHAQFVYQEFRHPNGVGRITKDKGFFA